MPDTLLSDIDKRPARLFKRLRLDTGLRLPEFDPTWLGNIGGVLLMGGIIAAIVALFTGHGMFGAPFVLAALAGVLLLSVDPGRLPAGLVTVADLVRRTVPLNAIDIQNAGGRPADRWAILVALSAKYGRVSPDQIGPETFLHRASLKAHGKSASA